MVMYIISTQKPALNGKYSVNKLQEISSKSDESVDTLAEASSQEDGSHVVLADSDSDVSPSLTSPSVPLYGSEMRSVAVVPDAVQSTDSDIRADDLSPLTRHKMVAIDTSQNKHFTSKLLPAQSPEFDNVIDQVCMNVEFMM